MSANPGTKEALAAGCLCPAMDNAYGKGYRQYDDGRPPSFIYNGDCAYHQETILALRESKNARS